MEKIWILIAEVLVEPGDLPSGATRAFTTVTTWAESSEKAREKLAHYLGTFKWKLLDVEQVSPYAEEATYHENVAEMVERTKDNPEAVLLGEFHSYRPD